MQLSKDFKDLLDLLNQHGARYLIVSGYAVAAHSVPRYTKDLDIWVEASVDNGQRIVVAALDEFGFGSLGLTVEDFAAPDQVVQLGYEPNRIDLLTAISGVRFEDAYPVRINVAFEGLTVPVIDRASLIANKRATARPRDLLDAAELER